MVELRWRIDIHERQAAQAEYLLDFMLIFWDFPTSTVWVDLPRDVFCLLELCVLSWAATKCMKLNAHHIALRAEQTEAQPVCSKICTHTTASLSVTALPRQCIRYPTKQ